VGRAIEETGGTMVATAAAETKNLTTISNADHHENTAFEKKLTFHILLA
jgi:hypothetical protein